MGTLLIVVIVGVICFYAGVIAQKERVSEYEAVAQERGNRAELERQIDSLTRRLTHAKEEVRNFMTSNKSPSEYAHMTPEERVANMVAAGVPEAIASDIEGLD